MIEQTISLMNEGTAADMIAALRTRQLSAVELVDRSIARIETHDPALNAVVVRDFERARRAAAAADEALASGDRRPLLGLPITVKEAFNVSGLPTTWGIPGTEDWIADDDAVAVARLKAAGAIIVGKTNVPTNLADWQTNNPIHGVTNNPWDLRRTPGGSSGGGAAALAADFVRLELGSDLAGSLRVPAHFCGVFAHKPTHGVVPMRGMAPPGVPSLSLAATVDLAVVGPMARSAADLSLALDVVAGPDDADSAAYTIAFPPPRHERLRDFRVLIVDRHPLIPTAGVVRDAMEAVAECLAALGCRVARSDPRLPDLAHVASLYVQLLMAFVGADVTDEDYEGLILAAMDLPPSDTSLAAESVRAMTISHRDWVQTDRARVTVAHQWRALFREWDVVLCPVMPTLAFAHDHRAMDSRTIAIDGQEVPYTHQSIWASIATLTGLPATAMPIGSSAEGLPIGMQIIGPYLEDRTTLAFAEELERELGGFVAPPRFAS
ncbi:MAG TPA: amidase [Thermomicrobiales bacterium]|nr:amidase [Thermomicrobiales bacterium]